MPGPEPVVPYVLAMVVCDFAWRDHSTGKATLLGVFATFQAPVFPAVQPQLGVYVAMTEGYGTVQVSLRIVDANEERDPIVTAEGVARFDDPRGVAEIILNLARVTFPTPGEYRIQLFAGGAGPWMSPRPIAIGFERLGAR